MNEKITFQQLAESLSSLTGGSQNTTETFIKELFSEVTEALAHGENVKIKGIGSFSPSGFPDQPILFSPDSELAEAINAPFSCFEAIEISNDFNDEMLNEDETSASDEITSDEINPDESPEIERTDEYGNIYDEEPEENPKIPSVLDNESLCVETISYEEPSYDEQSVANSDNQTLENVPLEENANKNNEPDDVIDVDSEYCNDEDRTKRSLLIFIIIVLISLIIGYLIGSLYPYHNFINRQNKTTPVATECFTDTIVGDTIKLDSIIADTIPTKPAIVITDTIRATRFLTTMSREYYGEMIFWVYIYEENKEKLGNPNKIKPGTSVIIPDAEKYGINRFDSISIEQAKLKAIEIYAPYEK